MLATGLMSFLVLRLPGQQGNAVLLNLGPVEKLALTMLTLFLGSVFLNVYRGRLLMKQLDVTISAFHEQWGFELPIVPCELDTKLKRSHHTFSSTRIAALAHFLLFACAAVLTTMAWTHWQWLLSSLLVAAGLTAIVLTHHHRDSLGRIVARLRSHWFTRLQHFWKALHNSGSPKMDGDACG
jgi:hypothetical protein